MTQRQIIREQTSYSHGLRVHRLESDCVAAYQRLRGRAFEANVARDQEARQSRPMLLRIRRQKIDG